ncbi:peptidase M61 domain-containing protein [Aspergillus uvarum CBS 121591]|uniref:Peptidase M61 domain-containing protein n=1 Tax=Aspergillus uvarum CBS 121591 TaxID=1448315 RepID=A0A319CR88_9EURO|nr:peptidase M61 domain-containing protein [Aspergillus uvarum CBS 121591]PYH86701.1 peptidase M61 domain-containing protein [Aspergillus uvarum CBS 121591]
MNYCPQRPPNRSPSALKLTVTPHFTADAADRLSVHLTLQNPQCAAHHPLFLFETSYGNVPAHPYTERDITASDAAGQLFLFFHDPTDPTNTDQEWRVDRDTVGDVQLRFRVTPRAVDLTTPIGPRVDLRRDQGGLIGNGRWFLPRPADERVYRHVVAWDLSHAPPRTRAVWSFGEGPDPVVRAGPPTVLIDSVYMVGPIKSYPCNGNIVAAAPRAQVFWFGQLPENLQRLHSYSILLYPKLAAFFRNPDAVSYHIFIRRVLRGFGGHGCQESYVLEYDASSEEETEEDLVALFSHEMVHSFVMMGPEADGYGNGWFIEGLAQFYSAYLPYRFGLRGAEYLRHRINAYLGAYGTSPRIGMDARDSQTEFYDDWYAELIPYMRGCAYLLQVDSRLRKMTGRFGLDADSPLDEVVIDMARRWRSGERLQASDWLDYLRPFLGAGVAHELQDMLRGRVLNLGGTIVIHEEWGLSPSEQEILEFGFSLASVNQRVICGVVPGSRAANAGLEDGLPLVSTSRAGRCSTSLSATMDVVVVQGGDRVQILYWPRSFDKARVWQLE